MILFYFYLFIYLLDQNEGICPNGRISSWRSAPLFALGKVLLPSSSSPFLFPSDFSFFFFSRGFEEGLFDAAGPLYEVVSSLFHSQVSRGRKEKKENPIDLIIFYFSFIYFCLFF